MLIYVLNSIFLVISTAFLFTKKKTPTLFNLFKKITFFILILSAVKGMVLSGIFWINYYYFPKFIEDCPFNFSLNKAIKLISKNNNYKKNCGLKRCIFHNISNNGNKFDKYNYLCNYNVENSKNKVRDINCKYIVGIDYSETSLYSYLNKCKKYSNYFMCSVNAKKHDNYFVKYDQKCPKDLNKKKYIALGVLFPFVDFIADTIIWLFIYSQYKCILKLNNFEFAAFLRFSPSSLNSTKDSSIIKPNNNNRNIFREININQTEMIIYPPLNNTKPSNNNNDNNKEIREKRKINLKSGKNNNYSLSDSKNELTDDGINISTTMNINK